MRTGYQLAIAVAAVTALVAAAALIAEATSSGRDPTAHGRLGLPGTRQVDLPAGDTTVFYGESASTRPPDEALRIPAGLDLLVASRQTGTLGSTASGGEQFDDAGHVWRPVARFDVPESRTYRASSRFTSPATEPLIGFGTSDSRDYLLAAFVAAGGGILTLILATGAWIRGRREPYE